MGQPVVHFEVMGKDGPGLREYYSELFGWEFSSPAPDAEGMDYEVTGGNAPDGSGIGGGVGGLPEGEGEPSAKAESLGGKRAMGPIEIMDEVVIGQFLDPEGNLIGVVKPGEM
ncbi:MAG: glyoxalase [Actinobacteria bacterium]|nr:glyoxalase [Actinomycetota bacterium]